MSDPVTHAEIEDVLSSIRRLVSEDTRSQPAAPEPAARLVLTPALRVQEPETPGSRPPAAEPDAEALAEPAEPAEQAAEEGPQTGFDAGGEGPDAGSFGAEAAAGPAEPLEEPLLAFRHHRDLAAERAEPKARQENTEDLAPPAAAAEPSGDAGGAGPDAPWGNPETTLFAAAAGAGRSADAEAEADEAAEAAKAAPVLLTEENLASSTAGARAASVVRKIAEMEARSSASKAATQQHWEPDSQTEAPFAGAGPDTIEWRDEPLPPRRPARPQEDARGAAAGGDEPEMIVVPDSAEAAQHRETAGTPADTVVEDAVTGAAMDALAEEEGDSYLDEDSLRDLVASIVREELRGPLGERITRNVRKLVRREIHRALAAHDLL
ncbi:hypothetical protein [Leisingera sp. JC11]|uniref:hypothetical protein n=1 Tax=Leisingera sp. JC11 TaxID=3042469 RepID=UPI0034543A03